MRPALVIIIAYLIGSIPFGYLIVRTSIGSDVRETGSGGTGATNVSRRAGRAAGAVTLLLDALKGAAAVAIARLLFGLPIAGGGGHSGLPPQSTDWWIAIAAVAVILGHIFPVWLQFRGGKGVATGVGVFLLLVPIAVALAAMVFLLVVMLTRYVSLGSILGAVAIPLFVWLQHSFLRPVEPLMPIMVAAVTGAALIVCAHRGNIGRLIRRSENKFN